MAKPVNSSSMDQARKIQSTIVPIEDVPLRRPYLNLARQNVDVALQLAALAQAQEELAAHQAYADAEVASADTEFVLSETALSMVTAEVIQRLGPGQQESIDEPALRQIVKEQLREWRPLAWEDDISRNTCLLYTSDAADE